MGNRMRKRSKGAIQSDVSSSQAELSRATTSETASRASPRPDGLAPQYQGVVWTTPNISTHVATKTLVRISPPSDDGGDPPDAVCLTPHVAFE